MPPWILKTLPRCRPEISPQIVGAVQNERAVLAACCLPYRSQTTSVARYSRITVRTTN